MNLDSRRVQDIISLALQEDIGSGDVTSNALLPNNIEGRGFITAKRAGVICGLDVARRVFEQVDPQVHIMLETSDGEVVEAGQKVMIIDGKANSILAAERVALNFLNVLSGTATQTKKFVDALEGSGVKILDTRKTIPGMRYLQKYAVKVGGGHNHRMGLYDMVLIKDNHIVAAGSVQAALKNVDDVDLPVEIECKTIDQVKEAAELQPDWIMLDNMTHHQIKEAVGIISGRCKVEASGGITLDNVKEVAQSGVNAISIGALTHSSHNNALDLSLDMKIKKQN